MGELPNPTPAFCAEARLTGVSAGPVLCDPGSPPLVGSPRPPALRRRTVARLVTSRSWPRPAEHRGPKDSEQRSPGPTTVDDARQVTGVRGSRQYNGRRTRRLAAGEPRGSISDDTAPDDPGPRFARRLELARGLVSPPSPLSFFRELA
jgi:hypothetical protein